MPTILLADDEPHMRTLVRTTLERPAYRILEAADGAAALELARREVPDVAILDWTMPGLSGVEVVAALRAEPATATVPIIMLTARGQQADKGQAVALGTFAYLVKPFSPLELLAKVEEVLRASPVAGVGTLATRAAPDPAAEEIDDPQLALYVRDLKRTVETEREHARQLAEANARLQVLDRMKSDFLAFISHELRTPLCHMAVLDMYDSAADAAEQTRVIDMIRNGYERLNAFIVKGLEYIEWLAVEGIVPEVTDLGAVVRDVVAGLTAPGRCRVALPEAAMRVHGKARDHATVVRILAENALRFSGADQAIEVTVSADAVAVRLTVADRGRGFPPEMAGELFRPFTIADAAHHARGTGLNLALASAIVDAHGGRITAVSAGVGTGATFTVELPVAAAVRGRSEGGRRAA